MQPFDWFHTYQSRRWQRRALAAEAREAMLRRDLERALERYHEMLDERNRLLRIIDDTTNGRSAEELTKCVMAIKKASGR